MKKLLLGLVLLNWTMSFAQAKFEKMPEGANEIHFKYNLSTKIFIDETGVYADSLFFKKNFPKIEVVEATNPNAYYLNTKADVKAFRGANKDKLLSILYHVNEKYTAVHYLDQNKSVIYAERNDDEVREIYNKYFNKEYYGLFNYKEELDYERKINQKKYPLVNYEFTFDEIQKNINWSSKIQGQFMEHTSKKEEGYFSAVTFDENLPKFVSLGYVFTNSDFGVTKVESDESILELTEVNYK